MDNFFLMRQKWPKKGNFDYTLFIGDNVRKKYASLNKTKLFGVPIDVVESIGNIFKDIGDNLRPLEARKLEK